MSDRLAYSLPEAAEVLGMSESTVRRLVRATAPIATASGGVWPPLPAKRTPSGAYLITRAALDEWLAALPDA